MERKYMKRFQSYKKSLEALSEARERDMSDDVWMQMLEIRNRLTYDYDGEIVKAYCQTIVNVYIEKLKEFQLWAEGIEE